MLENGNMNNHLVCLFHKFHKLRLLDKVVKLSKSEFIILDKMMKMKAEGDLEPKETISNMAKYMSTTTPAASKMLSTIEDKGYVKRVYDKEDKRLTYVTMTDEGELAILEAYKSFDEFTKKVFDRMGEKDLQQFAKLFSKLLEMMEEEVIKKG